METNRFTLDLLVNTVQSLSLAGDLENIMQIVRSVARKLTGADGSTFILRDGDHCYYADEDSISPLWKGNRFPMDRCVSGWVMNHRQPIVIEDIYADERVPSDLYRPTFVRSMAMVPIRTMDPIGAIGNYWAVNHLPSEEEVGLLQALADITTVSIENILVKQGLEQKVSERTRELNESLQQEKQKNEQQSNFLSLASHELRTPLTTILSSASIAQQFTKTNQQSKREKHLDRIQVSANNLVHIIEDFLAFGKENQNHQGNRAAPFDLEKSLVRQIESLEHLCKPGQRILFTYEGNAEVHNDQQTIANIVVNLLSNAIKYSEKDVVFKVTNGSGLIHMTLQDEGIGIPLDQQNQIFSRFFRANNVSGIKGTGLGLHIVKQYVDRLQGNLQFESRPGSGTTFNLVLPDPFPAHSS